MKKLRTLTVILLSSVFFAACGPGKEELAQELLSDAQQAMQNANYNEAKLKVDSIDLLYPNQIETIAQGKTLLQRIELQEQEQSLHYYDTLLVKRQAEFDKMVKSFVYKKGKFEGYAGTYVHKRQQIKNSHDRSYVRAYLDENGDFYISSRYHGKGHIYHNSIKVYNEGLFAQTEEIPKGSFDNRSFDDGEDFWETVNYRNGTDNGVVSFIVNNYDKRLKVDFRGKKHYYIVLENYDKEAIRDAYNLSLIIKEIANLKDNKSKAEARIKSLKKTLNAQQ